MPLLNIPEEVIELRNTLRDFIDREVRPIEESHRQEKAPKGKIHRVGRFERGYTNEDRASKPFACCRGASKTGLRFSKTGLCASKTGLRFGRGSMGF